MSLLGPAQLAFGLLTRLPVRAAVAEDAELGRAIAYFPVVGLAIGLSLAGGCWLLQGSFSPSVVAIVLVGLSALLTGGLHIDGIADVFDGLGGGRGDRERMLAIMRDSRIGAHGAAALCLVLIAKACAMSEIVQRGGGFPVVCCPVVARWAILPLLIFFPCARSEGLASAFHRNGRVVHLVFGTLFTAGVVAWGGRSAIVPTVAALAIALGLGVWIHRRLGGLTGDVYGAAIELSEVAFLIAAGRG
jgi:adenosylcobinamide-GDP ribazoletransferase